MSPGAAAGAFGDLASLAGLTVAPTGTAWIETATLEEWEELSGVPVRDEEEWLAARPGRPAPPQISRTGQPAPLVLAARLLYGLLGQAYLIPGAPR